MCRLDEVHGTHGYKMSDKMVFRISNKEWYFEKVPK